MQESLSVTSVEQLFNEDASELYDLMYLGGIEFTKETNETLKVICVLRMLKIF